MNKEINKAEHYNAHPSGVECIQVIRHMTHNVGAAIKYLWRNGLKPGNSAVKDLNKAIYYCADEIERLGGVVEWKPKATQELAQ